ncbi:MAG: hypothetical protein KF824_02195 [Fimbriimonadaceae bacterium]|nr:hypothetical protein [Fimbriimonadaceae bacterium]QYK53712.1 MAG: hypothetical protein KF824_02195 [Fimbriimonadaceae bacterium]
MKVGKIIAIGILAIIAVFFGVPLLTGLIGGLLALILKLAIPALIVLGVLYAIYRISGADKSLPGNGKSLP